MGTWKHHVCVRVCVCVCVRVCVCVFVVVWDAWSVLVGREGRDGGESGVGRWKEKQWSCVCTNMLCVDVNGISESSASASASPFWLLMHVVSF